MTTSRPCSDSPRRNALRRSLAAVILGFCALHALGAQETRARDEAIARVLVEGAQGALSLGYRAEALELLDEALSFTPSSSDAAYLRALLALGGGEPRFFAERLLASALSSATFSHFGRADAEVLLAGILARTRRPDDALRFLGGKTRDAEMLFIETIARRALGDKAGSRSAVSESLRRFPSDPRPLMYWLSHCSPDPADPQDAALVRKAFAALPGLKEVDPGILVDIAPYAPNTEESRLLVREFRAANGIDPKATVQAFAYGLIDAAKATRELFSGEAIPDAADLKKLYALLPDTEARSGFLAAFSAFTGRLTEDGDGDGIPETASLYRQGSLVSWVRDGDQDGRPELMATLSESAPTEIRVVSGSIELLLTYTRWPFAASGAIQDGTLRRTYRFGEAVMALPLMRLDYLPGASSGPYLASLGSVQLPTERSLASRAWQVEERSTDLTTVAALDGAQVTRSWWQDSFGARGTATYRAGVPADERMDMDGDARFESRRVWGRLPDGSAVALYVESDFDGDGTWEYRETILPPYTKSWDIDTDGQPDLFLEKPSRGVDIYRFMPSWKKRLPLTVRLEDGVPVQATLGTADRPFIPDAGGRVTWIGSKPFDFGQATPGTGFGTKAGIRYAVTEIGGRLYAEILD